MKWSTLWLLSACLAAASCDRDPARAIKIPVGEARTAPAAAPPPPAAAPSADGPAAPAAQIQPAAAPPPQSGASRGTLPPADGKWHPQGCPPPPETSPGPGTFTATGPCAFQHHAIVTCEAAIDDFILTMARPAANGALLMVYINVEKYTGPGTYDQAQMFVGVQDKTSIYRWSSDEVSITVGADQKFAQLPPTKLESEPMLVDCTGPMLNYQCAGRTDSSPIDHTEEVVSGTLMCGAIGKSDK